MIVLAACSMGLPETMEAYRHEQGAVATPLSADGGAAVSSCRPERRPLPPEPLPAVRARRGACDKATLDVGVGCLLLETERLTKPCDDLFKAQDQTCLSCLRSKSTDAEQGPLIEDTDGTYSNVPGCIAHHDGTPNGCAAKLVAAWDCVFGSCSSCAADAFYDCVDNGAYGVCDAELVASECSDRYANCPDGDDLASAIKVAEVFCLAAPR